MPEGCDWLPYDTLELLPYLLSGIDAAAVIVDLQRWTPWETAPVLRRLRDQRPELTVIGIHDSAAEVPEGLAELACSDRRLAFACDADARLELLLRQAIGPSEEPTVCQILLDHFVPLGCDKVRSALIQMAVTPSVGRSIRAMSAALGWSEDALERRFADVGLSTPSSVRRLAVAAEGLWQVSARQHAAEDAARALGLGGADSLGRVIKSVFGMGLKAARLMGATGARRILIWTGLLALRDGASHLGLSSLRHSHVALARGTVAQCVGEMLVVQGASRNTDAPSVTVVPEVWKYLSGGGPLEHLVERLSDPFAGSLPRFTREIVPTLGKLLRHRLVIISPA
jgi:hypothetical protein